MTKKLWPATIDELVRHYGAATPTHRGAFPMPTLLSDRHMP